MVPFLIQFAAQCISLRPNKTLWNKGKSLFKANNPLTLFVFISLPNIPTAGDIWEPPLYINNGEIFLFSGVFILFLYSCMNTITWVGKMLKELGFKQNRTTIYQDNHACITMAHNGRKSTSYMIAMIPRFLLDFTLSMRICVLFEYYYFQLKIADEKLQLFC